MFQRFVENNTGIIPMRRPRPPVGQEVLHLSSPLFLNAVIDMFGGFRDCRQMVFQPTSGKVSPVWHECFAHLSYHLSYLSNTCMCWCSKLCLLACRSVYTAESFPVRFGVHRGTQLFGFFRSECHGADYSSAAFGCGPLGELSPVRVSCWVRSWETVFSTNSSPTIRPQSCVFGASCLSDLLFLELLLSD